MCVVLRNEDSVFLSTWPMFDYTDTNRPPYPLPQASVTLSDLSRQSKPPLPHSLQDPHSLPWRNLAVLSPYTWLSFFKIFV